MIKNYNFYCQEVDKFIDKFVADLVTTHQINSIYVIGSYAHKKGWRFELNDVDLLFIYDKNYLELNISDSILKAFSENAKGFKDISPLLYCTMMQEQKTNVYTVKTIFDLYFFCGDVKKELICKAYEYFRMKRIYGPEQQIKYIVIDKAYLKYFLSFIARTTIPRTWITYKCCDGLRLEIKRLLHEAIKMSLSSIDPRSSHFTGDIIVDFINNFKEGKNIVDNIAILDTSMNADFKDMKNIINNVSDNLVLLANNL